MYMWQTWARIVAFTPCTCKSKAFLSVTNMRWSPRAKTRHNTACARLVQVYKNKANVQEHLLKPSQWHRSYIQEREGQEVSWIFAKIVESVCVYPAIAQCRTSRMCWPTCTTSSEKNSGKIATEKPYLAQDASVCMWAVVLAVFVSDGICLWQFLPIQMILCQQGTVLTASCPLINLSGSHDLACKQTMSLASSASELLSLLHQVNGAASSQWK